MVRWRLVSICTDSLWVVHCDRLNRQTYRQTLFVIWEIYNQIWSSFSQKKNEDKTNNYVESWHRGLNRSLDVNQSYQNIYKYVQVLREEDSRQMTKVLEAASHAGKPRKQREDFAERNKNLQNVCLDYASFGTDKLFFLESIVKNLKFSPVDSVDPVVDLIDPADLVEPVDSIVPDEPEAEQNVQNEADSDVPDLLEESGM